MREDAQLLLDAVAFRPENLVPTAWAGHIPFANYVVRKLKPKVFVELGTHHGASYFAVCQTVKENQLATKTYAVDTWQGDSQAGYYANSVYESVKLANQQYRDFSTLLRGTFDDALKNFDDSSIDLLHIDGFHTYEAVKHDFETWLPKLKPGATILFHDTHEFRADFGVYKFWAELMHQYRGFEFTHSHGLGVLQLEGAKVNLIPEANELAQHIAVFENAGAAVQQRIFEAANQGKTTFQVINELQTRVKNLESSTSWKATRPFRALSSVLKRG